MRSGKAVAVAVEKRAVRCTGLVGAGLFLAILSVLGGSPLTASAQTDWVIDVDPALPGPPISPALLGHYDLSGALFDYDQEPGLMPAMSEVGFSEWRVGVGRWEAATNLLPALTSGAPCLIALPEQAAATGPTDAALIASRDWFTDTGSAVTLADTQDDARYALGYFRSVLDVADAFGASAFVSIDSMPLALAVNQTPSRADCEWSFQNAVSNVRPASATIFAAAVTGLVERIIEGSGGEPARVVTHWEIWNEPEFPQFWDPAYEDLAGPLDRYFEMAINALFALNTYRASSTHPNAADLRFGLGSFATSAVAATTLGGFDSAALPGGIVPLDFISFHGYSNDPLDIVAGIDEVAAAMASSTNYQQIEMVLGEWGPNLGTSAGDPIYAASIQPALHIATILALGASAGLDRAHRAIFWDFYPNSIRLGLLDHDLNPRSAYRAYELLNMLIGDGFDRLVPVGLSDGRLDGGLGAVLASRGPGGTVRVLLVNRNLVPRTVEVRLAGAPASASRVFSYDDPMLPIGVMPVTGSDVTVPAESLVLLEFGPPAVPMLGTIPLAALLTALLGAAVRLKRSIPGARAPGRSARDGDPFRES